MLFIKVHLLRQSHYIYIYKRERERKRQRKRKIEKKRQSGEKT